MRLGAAVRGASTIKTTRRRRRIYNFTHSKPGNPPYKQSGRLRASIAWEVNGLTGRVGTNVLYGLFLELGTRMMKRRPWLVKNLMQHRSDIEAIIQGRAKAGSLTFGPTENRSGVTGAGAREAGY